MNSRLVHPRTATFAEARPQPVPTTIWPALGTLARQSLSGMVITLLFGTAPAVAHHSYAMFDMSAAVIVEGSVAKLEWVNPHTFVGSMWRKRVSRVSTTGMRSRTARSG